MSKIAVIIANMFEDSVYSEPVKSFLAAGHKIIHIGLRAGDTVKGLKRGTPVKIDKAVKGLSSAGFDALPIPGRYSRICKSVPEKTLRVFPLR